jgi:chitodextrinase
MSVSGFRVRIDGGTPVDVGNVLEYEVLGLSPATTYSFEVQSYDNAGNFSAWSLPTSVTTASATNPILVGHGDSMMWGSGDENTDPTTENPSIQTLALLTGTWNHTNVGVPGASFENISGSPSDLLAGAVATVDPLYVSTALHKILITNGGINNVVFVGGTIATGYPDLLNRLKRCYLQYGAARHAVGWKTVVSPLPVSGFPGTPTDYESFLRGPFNAWLAANFQDFADEYADWTGNANIGDGANTNNATYFDQTDPDSGGTGDHLHLTAAGYAIEATYFRDAIERITLDTTVPSVPSGVTATALNCEQIEVGYSASTDHIHHYEVEVNGGSLVDDIVNISKTSPYVVKNLEGDTLYSIRMRAVDVAGHHSPWSSAHTATTASGDFSRLHAVDVGRNTGGTVSGWEDDAAFTPVGSAVSFSAFTPNTIWVKDPATTAVYQSVRLESSFPDVVGVTFGGLDSAHHHRVRLHFVTPTFTNIGAYVQDIAVNGITVASSYDVVIQGGGNQVVTIVEAEVAAGPTSIPIVCTNIGTAACQLAGAELFGVTYTPPPPSASSKIDIGRTTGGVVSLWDDEVTTGVSVSGGTAFNQTADTPDTTGETSPAPEAVYRNCRYELGAGAITAVVSGLTPSATYTFRTHHWSSSGNISSSMTMKCTANGVEKFNQAMVFSANGVYIQSFTVAADGSGEVTLVFEKVTTGAIVCGIEWS